MNVLLIISAFYSHFCTQKMLQCYGVYPPMCVWCPKLFGKEWTISAETPNLVALIVK